MDVRIILRDLLHDWRLRKPNSDNQIVVSCGKRTHCRLDGVRCSWFDIAQDNRQVFRCTLYSLPRGGVERPVVFTTDVEDDANVNLRAIIGRITLVTTQL